MNETLKTIMARNSCRDFKDTPLTKQQLDTIIGAALAAPSAMNRQPWHLVVVQNKAFIEEMDADGMGTLAAAEDQTVYNRFKERGGKLFYNAPCLVYILGDGSPYSKMDSGILCQNIALAAQSIGLSSCIVGMANVPLTGLRGGEYKKRMNFPEGYEFAIGILLGNPISGKEPHEPDFSKVSYVES